MSTRSVVGLLAVVVCAALAVYILVPRGEPTPVGPRVTSAPATPSLVDSLALFKESRTLVALPVDAEPTIDGDGRDAAWVYAPPILVVAKPVFTIDGLVPEEENLPMEVRACSTGGGIVVRVTWDDTREDRAPPYETWPGYTTRGDDFVTVEWGTVLSNQVISKIGKVEWTAAGEDPTEPAVARGRWMAGRWTLEVRCPSIPVAANYVTLWCTDASSLRGGAAEAWLRRGTAVRVVEERVPLAVLDGFTARDVDVSVRFRTRGGDEDRGGGLIFRSRGDRDYYVLRANALEQSVVQSLTRENVRVDLPPIGREAESGTKVAFDPTAWHTLRATVVGGRIQAYLDGRHLYDVLDETFPHAGAVGLWSEADSVMAFDDLVVISLDPPPSPGR